MAIERRAWLKCDDAQLRRLARRGLTFREIGERMGRDKSVVRVHAEMLGIEVKRAIRRIPWTDAEVDTLRRRYPDETAEVIARDLGRTVSTTHQMAQRLGLMKSDAFRERERAALSLRAKTDPRYQAGQIKPGTPSWNKGTKGVMGQHPNSVRTRFQKGHMAGAAQHNWVPVGTEKFDPKRGVIVRKTTDDSAIYPAARWQPVHRLVWEGANGPVPPGHVCVFRPGMKTLDSALITLDRVEVVTHVEQMRRNSIHTRYPPEVRHLIQLKGALNRKINRRNKANEQDQRRA